MSTSLPPSDVVTADVAAENKVDENSSTPESPECGQATPASMSAADSSDAGTNANSRSSSTSVEMESPHFSTTAKQFNIFGGTFHNTSFDGDGGKTKFDVTWQTELKVVDPRRLSASGDEPDTVFDAVCEAWPRFRIVVLRYHPGEQRRAEKLILRIAYWASSNSAPEPQLLTTGNDRILALRDLALPNNWPKVTGPSLVHLARRTEPMTTRFFSISNGIEVQDLDRRLDAKDARLLVSLAAEWDAVEGYDPFDHCVFALEVVSSTRIGSGVPVLDDESHFDVIPRIVAGLFPGLPVHEYLGLVDRFAPKLESQAPQRGQTERHQDATVITQAPPTRHQRWVSGDIDRVLAELGISYDAFSQGLLSRTGEESSPGYYLADGAGLYADPGWIVANYPSLLASRMEWLLVHYLCNDGSARFQEAFLVCCARLDAAGIHRVDLDWLMRGWNTTLDTQGDIDRATRNLYIMVEYLQTGRSDSEARFARTVVDGFADLAAELELEFQRKVGIEPLQQAVASLEGVSLTEADKVWGWLIGNSATSVATKLLADRQAAAIWMLMSLAQRWPTQVAQAMTRLLARVTSPESAWRMMGRALPQLNHVPRCAALNLEYLLSHLIDVRPELWVSFARGVADAYEHAVQDVLAERNVRERLSDEAKQGAVDGQRLAYICLYVLAPRIYASKQTERQHLLELFCPVGDERMSDGSLLGRMMAMTRLSVSEEAMLGPLGEGVPTRADIVRLLRGVTLALQNNEVLSTEQVSEALTGVLFGLREFSSTQEWRALIDQARDSLDSQFQQRDLFERAGDRTALVSMRKRIRATQAVLRGLRASK